MSKIMISQPMKGLTKKQIEENREKVVNELTKKGYKIIDSIIPNVDSMNAIRSLAESIKFLSEADVLYMMKGWEHARGCKIEHTIAKEYEVKIIYEL